MKRLLAWSVGNADVLIALTLAVLVSALDVLGIASTAAVQNATVTTLAVVAFVLLRDRMRSDVKDKAVHDAVLATGAGLHELTESLQRRSAVRVVVGAEFNRLLAEARRDTDRWVFKGSTGAYVRAITLPECIQQARRNRRALMVRLEILDPTNERLCARFVQLHQRLAVRPDSPERKWTMDGTRREVFATILSSCWHQQRYELLDINIGLSSVISTFRYELSSGSLIITQRGPDFPATVIENGSLSYDCWNTELYASLQQSRVVPMDRAKSIELSDEPSIDQIRDLFRGLNIELPPEYDDAVLGEIRRMALQVTDPYETEADQG